MPVILITDVLVWLLVAAALGYAWYCRRHPHLAVPWGRVFRSSAALASAVILGAYIALGLLDSLHFRPALQGKAAEQKAYSSEVLSVLDVVLAHLRGRGEKTYSAPLATRSYAKEQIELPDGRQMRDFPRLRVGGAHLKDESEWAGDVTKRALSGFAASVVLILLLLFPLKKLKQWRPDIPWGAAGASAAALLLLAGPALALSSGYHVLGTDKVGQDVFYLALKSVRTSLVIGTLTTLVLLPVGIALGIAAGYFKGWIDDVIQYFYTTLNSIPGVLLIAAAVLMMQVVIDRNSGWFDTAAQRADFRLLILCAILGLTSWTGLARLLRGEALKLSQLEYIQAAHAFGVRDTRILARHILPNVSHIVIIAMVMDFSGLVLAEAVLSYVGVGVDPSTNSFGTMINAARLEMSREPVVWWALATAFSFMFALVLAANLFADAVRDGFDPRVRM
ncbi:MAG: ABC transporter permease [Candidatus Parcubacteria bacterium]|nr:ABC transporter permease [Burkholderiales bacterium]